MTTDDQGGIVPLFDCPGGPADLLGPGIGRCRHCDFVFATVMDEPTLPPHQTRGDVTTFGAPDA